MVACLARYPTTQAEDQQALEDEGHLSANERNIKFFLTTEKQVAISLIEQCDYTIKGLDNNHQMFKEPFPEAIKPMSKNYFTKMILPLIKNAKTQKAEEIKKQMVNEEPEKVQKILDTV